MSLRFCRRLLVATFVVFTFVTVVVPSPTPTMAACPANTQPCNDMCISEKDLCILEPVPGGPSVVTPGGAPLAIFFNYINSGVWQWAYMMGVAIAVLNGTIGGLQIVMSNGDSGKVENGKSRFISSTIGLVMLLLAGVILEFINPIGFDAI